MSVKDLVVNGENLVGWTVMEKASKNGRIDKYYTSPNGKVFDSLVKVMRSLQPSSQI